MCKVRDAAAIMLNKSIELAEKEHNPAYYMDFIKLHKLLYLAQCYMLSKHEMTLFEETISARKCGPYVDGIGFVPGRCGFGEIKNYISAEEDDVPFFPISFLREEALDIVLRKFGTKSTDEIVAFTKSTVAYLEHEGNYEQSNTISIGSMKNTDLRLFQD